MPRAEEEEEPLALRASAPLPRVPPRPQAPPPARRPSNMTSSFAQAGFPPRMKPTLPLFSAPQPKPQLTIGPFGDGLELAPASQMVPSSTVLQPLPGMTQGAAEDLDLGYVDTSLSEEGYTSSMSSRQNTTTPSLDSSISAWMSNAFHNTVHADRENDRAAMLSSPDSGSSGDSSSGSSNSNNSESAGCNNGSSWSTSGFSKRFNSTNPPLPAYAGAYGKPIKRRPSRRRPSPRQRDFQAAMTAKLPPMPAIYVIGCEFCERFSYYGMRAVLGLFFVQRLHMTERVASEAMALFVVACYVSPLLGAYLSDALWGRYTTITRLSGVYFMGSCLLAAAAASTSAGGVFTALSLVALGTGGIKPCVSAFGGDQIDPPEPVAVQRFFSFFYASINAGSLLSSVATPLVRQSCGYAAAFSLPALLMAFALALLVSGRRTYRRVPPRGNLFADVFGALWEALSAWRGGFGTVSWHKCLDAAAPRYGLLLVADLRRVGRVLCLLAPAPLFWCLFDQQASRWTFQAAAMDLRLGPSFIMAPEMMQALNALLILVLIPLFDRVLYPLVSSMLGPRAANHHVRKMAAGMACAAGSFLMAAKLQDVMDTRASAAAESESGLGLLFNSTFNASLMAYATSEAAHSNDNGSYDGKVWVLWQVPQYVVMTCGEVLFSVTGLEFAFREAPASMKSVVQSCFLLTTAMGNLLTAVALESCTRGLSQAAEFRLFAGGCFAALATLLVIACALGVGPDGGLGGLDAATPYDSDVHDDFDGEFTLGGGVTGDQAADSSSSSATGGRKDSNKSPSRWANAWPSSPPQKKKPVINGPLNGPDDTSRPTRFMATAARRAVLGSTTAYNPMGAEEEGDNGNDHRFDDDDDEEEEISLTIGITGSRSNSSSRSGSRHSSSSRSRSGRDYREANTPSPAQSSMWAEVPGAESDNDDNNDGENNESHTRSASQSFANAATLEDDEDAEFHEALGEDEFSEEELYVSTRIGHAGGELEKNDRLGNDSPLSESSKRTASEVVVDVL